MISRTPSIHPDNIYANLKESSILYDRQGNVLETLYQGDGHRINISYEEIPDQLIHAIVATEDKTFWTHHGFNIPRIFGAIRDSFLHGGTIRGTSTITQQLARNVYLPETKSERSLNRKISEAWYTVQLEMKLSKKKILEAYLNTIYFGDNAYGIQAASRTYFSKDASQLNLIQCVALASIPSSPDHYALVRNLDSHSAALRTQQISEKNILMRSPAYITIYNGDTSRARRTLVLDNMVASGYLTPEEASQAKQVSLRRQIRLEDQTNLLKATYFTDFVTHSVIQDLEESGYSASIAQEMLYTGGLRIHTTLDPKVQSAIDREFDNQANFPAVTSSRHWHHQPSKSTMQSQGAMVIIDYRTGEIRGMRGGRETKTKRLYNRATHPRQPGSAIKPLSVYSTALQEGADAAKTGHRIHFRTYDKNQKTRLYGSYWTAASKINDAPLILHGKVWPHNAYHGYKGIMTLRKSVECSCNVNAVRVFQQVGSDQAVQQLKRFGITSIQESGTNHDKNAAALALGGMTYGISPVEMASAYGTFPNMGVHIACHSYTRISTRDGKTLLNHTEKKTRVIEEGTAFIIGDILRTSVSRGTGKAAKTHQPTAGKTGTTSEQNDAWFCGYTPQYAAACWIGADSHFRLTEGSAAAARLWRKIMNRATAGESGTFPSKPSSVIRQGGEYYVKGTEKSSSYKKGNEHE